MKEARNIFALIALAFTLGVYDVLKERMNFSTLTSLIVILIMFAVWLVAFLVLNKFVFNRNTEEANAQKKGPQQKIHSQNAKSLSTANAKVDDGLKPASGIKFKKIHKKRDRGSQKRAEPQLHDEQQAPDKQKVNDEQLVSAESNVADEPKLPIEPRWVVEPLLPVEQLVLAELKLPAEPKWIVGPQLPVEHKLPAEPKLPVGPKRTDERQLPVKPKKPVEPMWPTTLSVDNVSAKKLAALENILVNSCLTHGITGAAIVTHSGVLLVSTPFAGSRKEIAIAISASIFSLSARLYIDMGRDRLMELVVRGDEGFLFFQDIAHMAFLILIVEHDILIGGVIQVASRCTKSAADVLKS